MEYSNILKEISEGIGKGEFAIFCGAGISFNSGLPLANELKQYILKKLFIDEEDIKEIMDSKLPFEAFMEILSKNIDISKILDIFEEGEPNTNHILIAKLAKNSYLKTIFTTNFDLLIENALEKEGLKSGEDFNVYYDEGQFSRINFENTEDGIVRIFKIHGSIDNWGSIRTTMKAVASKTLSNKRMDVIRYLFSAGRHKKVLILGYSCSDEFDITPQIQSLKRNLKEIIFVDHSEEEKEEIEDIRIKTDKNPFKNFSGKRIKCNTDKFIERLWGSLEGIIGEEYKPIKCEPKWKKYVDEWAKKLEEDKGFIKHYIASDIFYKISNFNKALKYSEKSLAIAEEIGDKEGELACHMVLGVLYRNLGDSKKAIKYYDEALKNVKLLENITYEAMIYENLGMAYFTLGDFKNALNNYEKSLKIVKEIRKIENRTEKLLGISEKTYIFMILGKKLIFHVKNLVITRFLEWVSRKIPKFVRSYKEACKEKTFSNTRYIDTKGFFTIVPPPGWKILEYKEDPRGKVTFIGPELNVDLRILASVKDFDTYDELFKATLENTEDIEKQTGIKVSIEKTTFLGRPAIKRSWIYRNIKFFAVDFMEGNIRHNLQYGATQRVYDRYLSIVMKSMETYEPIPKDVGDEDVRKHVIANKLRLAAMCDIENIESRCYEGLGIIHRNLRDFEKSIEYYKKAIEIQKEVGDKSGEATCYLNLGVAYIHLMNSKKAIECVKKALEISKQTGEKITESKCYTNLSAIYGELKNFKEAIKYAEKSLEIKKEIGDKAGEAVCYANLGAAYGNFGDSKKAIEYYLNAEKIFKEIGQEHYLKVLYGNMANAYYQMNNLEKAAEYKRKAEEI